jgi:hypothetical protein
MRNGAKSHEFSELTVLRWPEDEVKMVRHQAVGKYFDWDPIVRFGERSQEELVLIGMLKEFEPAYSSIHYMEHETTGSYHASSRHGFARFKFLAN